MSFGGGFGGFGQNNNNNQQQSSGFGGFGTPASSNPGAFGNNTTSAFGAKPSGFGTTTTTAGGLFGGGTATAGTLGFGGFGATNNTATSSPFGGNTSGGLFGTNKPAFGAAATSNPFGGTTTSSPFGTTTTGAFGAPASTALGAGAGECQGTGSVPFQAFVEKEPNSTTNQQNAFQNICFQQPYQKFSPEELRLADYNQGRRYGNASNQAGAFGQTNFGGFGATNNATFGANANSGTTSLFGGGAAATTTPFGATQPATGGFGATAGGGLFGANKPATSLFGTQPAASTTGSLFGNTGNAGFGATTGPFGATNTNTNTGTSLFGNNNAANAPKPTFSFGSSQPATTGTSFGNSTTTTGAFGGGLFGNNTQNTTPAFGAQPTTNTTFGAFGGNTQQTPSLFGSNTASKPTSLFGNTGTSSGGGIFGSNTAATTTTPFGSTTNNQNAGGLFGQKPATGSLFGNTTTQPSTNTGSLFGGFGNNTQNQTQQQNTSGGLFSGLNSNNNQPKPSLFGTSTQQQGGGSLFGNAGTQQSSLFNLNSSQQGQQQQQPQNSLFGGNNSMFNNSQQNQQPQQSLTASISDPTALGGSFFSTLGTNQIPNPGPLATPLSSAAKPKKGAALPMYKLNSASASRFTTPQKQRGFGFSYSTYGTPNSAASTASTPGAFGGSLLSAGSGNTFGRTLSKSMSTSSLRRSFNTEDSILAPGAFSASPNNRHFGSTGSVKRLTISRNIRQDLFSPPNPESQPAPSSSLGGILKKRVSFDANVNGTTNGASGPLKQSTNLSPTTEDSGYMRPRGNGSSSNGNTSGPEMEQVSNANNQLAIVNEEEIVAPAVNSRKEGAVVLDEMEAGEYWMRPTKKELENMTRAQRQKVTGFTVGCKGYGQVEFNQAVDLSLINLDEILDGIVKFGPRLCTVYPIAAKKPPQGQGLNVPSTISLENSWPRKNGSKENVSAAFVKKHIERLKKVVDTKYVHYEPATGTWTFTVEHFTTYGLVDDEEEVDEFGQSPLSPAPNTPTPKMRSTPRTVDQSFTSASQVTESDAEDTFEFRKKKLLPGAFDEIEAYVDDEVEQEYDEDRNSFLDERSVGSRSEDGVEEPMDQDDVFQDDESVSIVDQEMAGSYPEADNTTERDEADSQDEDVDMDILAETPGAVMRARMRAMKSGTPMKQSFAAGDDWANTLQTTISPRKQDRALLKSLIDVHGNETRVYAEPTTTARRVVSDGRGFATSIDLMNSLFGQAKSPVKIAKMPAMSKGFEWPYAKRSKIGEHDTTNMSSTDRSFHDSVKPRWGPDGTLVYAAASDVKPFGKSQRRHARERDGVLNIQKGGIVSESRDIRFAKFSNEAAAELLKRHRELAVIEDSGKAPFAYLPRGEFSFSEFAAEIHGRDPAASHEKLVWQLSSVLFDPIAVPKQLEQVPGVIDRLRKDKLSSFWQKLVEDGSNKHTAMARSNEEKAIACLSGHKVADACAQLVNSGDFHLATLVALIGSKDAMRKDMRQQLDDWQKSRMISEFSEPIRAIYELLAGNVCICAGSKGPEDRMESFVISKRFGLDWRQAFGLRLWYGILSGEPIESAVSMFDEGFKESKETAHPVAWYVEQKVPALWEDKGIASRQDLLWGLLKLYAFDDAIIEEVLRPENSQLSPLDVRLSWQLNQTLSDSGAIQFHNDDESGDRTTLSFASQLTNEGSWIDATFVLLHLSRDEARAKAIQDHLGHHAGKIGAEDSQPFTTLTKSFKIPASWIWEAKALHMRSVEKNSRAEVECLIKAGSFNEAHNTFAKEVAPRAIIELDHETLRTLLKGFAGKEESITEWHLGGEIYQDYLYLLDCDKKGRPIDQAVLQRLLAGLPAVVEESRYPAFMETVAIETMSGVVAKTTIASGRNGEKSNLSKVLKLPLTEDRCLKHTVELGLEYYRAVMASAR